VSKYFLSQCVLSPEAARNSARVSVVLPSRRATPRAVSTSSSFVMAWGSFTTPRPHRPAPAEAGPADAGGILGWDVDFAGGTAPAEGSGPSPGRESIELIVPVRYFLK
jgi:hypothetical protein